MATALKDPNGVKSNRCSTNASRKVRIIGKIRGFTDKESEFLNRNSRPWICVKNPEENGLSEKCRVFFETQSASRKDGYELDYCYEQHEELGQIYSREIQPMILEVFGGRNASVIALGARGSGKTYTIQGSQEKPGLAVFAMSEILSKAKELGKSVSVSLYELTQEHMKDLLNPNHPAIQVLEDAQGIINIKGLSQVPVKSITEFHNMYFTQGSQRTSKIPIDQPHNKGLMVHISSDDNKMKTKLATKINFVDLAGYEDLRKCSRDGIAPGETNRKNRSLYALLNVVSAINDNEVRVPYRENKLTRILQDSLNGRSHVLLLTCLNPSFCQDSLSTIILVSRSCRSTKQVLTDSTNRSQRSARVNVLSSLKSGKTMSASLSATKRIGDSRILSTQKASYILKGRKLFDEVKEVNPKQDSQDKPTLECSSLVEHIEDVNSEGPGSQSTLNLEKNSLPSAIYDESTIMTKMDVSSHSGIDSVEGGTPGVNSASTCEEHNILQEKDDKSPPLSERIRAICNNLKALCESTPLAIKMPDDAVAPYNSQLGYTDTADPQTPATELKSAVYCSPCGTFSNRSSKMKDSLVQEYLKFLNSANKEELKSLKGIGEKRATYILEMREESPEPFKRLDDLQDIGLSAKQIKGMMKQVAGALFD